MLLIKLRLSETRPVSSLHRVSFENSDVRENLLCNVYLLKTPSVCLNSSV